MKDFICVVTLIGGLLSIIIGIPYMANKQEQDDIDLHKTYIGNTIVLNKDTVEVLKWNTGRFRDSQPRGFVLSNGMTVDDIIVMGNNERR